VSPAESVAANHGANHAAVRDTYRIIKNELIADGICELILDAPDIARAATPGQFVNLYLSGGAMLLPRPISIAGADVRTGELSLIYAIVGAGTQALSLLRAASDLAPKTIEVMGPLGTGFFDYPGSLLATENLSKVSPEEPELTQFTRRKVILIGGGVGVPPLFFAAQRLREAYGSDMEIAAFLGYRAVPWLDERFAQICDAVHTISETIPQAGNVVDLLDAWREVTRTTVLALSCGPSPMLAAVAGWCARNSINLRVSLEERMGCGYGACAGCTAKTRPLNDPEKPQNGPDNAGADGIIKKKVCVHGPVFWADEVVW
jgi:dihydroorotate dehydrogenase electron transfer subunit